MSNKCDICQIYESKEAFNLLYEDETCFSILHEAGANSGHAMIIPKKHYPILEEVPNEEFEHMMSVANTISSSVFESLQAHGTNIMVNNGPNAGQEHAHFMIHVIPRYENDGVNLDWEMKQADQTELDQTKDLISEHVTQLLHSNQETSSTVIKDNAIEMSNDEQEEIERQLKRIP